jgi:hypothetical protein
VTGRVQKERADDEDTAQEQHDAWGGTEAELGRETACEDVG